MKLNQALSKSNFQLRHRCWIPIFLLLIAFDIGCGDSSTDPADTNATESPDTNAQSVLVISEEKENTVDLSHISPVSLDGVNYARLSEIVTTALPDIDLAMHTVDFEAEDGFMPNKSPNCTTHIPLAGSQLAQGYVQLQSRNMKWDDNLAFPGCMSLKNLAKIFIATE